MRKSVRNGLKMKAASGCAQSPTHRRQPPLRSTNTPFFRGQQRRTDVGGQPVIHRAVRAGLPQRELNAASLAPQSDRESVNRLFKQGETLGCFSDQIQLRSLRFGSNCPALSPAPCSHRRARAFMQKRKLCIGSLLPSWRSFESPLHIQTGRAARHCCRSAHPSPCAGILTGFLFDRWSSARECAPFDPFGPVLRSTHSMLTAIASKPFLTSVDKGVSLVYLLLPPRSAPSRDPGKIALCPLRITVFVSAARRTRLHPAPQVTLGTGADHMSVHLQRH